MLFFRLVTPILNSHRWETRPELGIQAATGRAGNWPLQGLPALGTLGNTKMLHFTPALAANPHQTPVGTVSTSQYTTHTRFGANSSSFYWPYGKCAFRSEHNPAPELLCHMDPVLPQPPGSSTSPFLPAWGENSASSQPEGADFCSRGWNQQSATWFP